MENSSTKVVLIGSAKCGKTSAVRKLKGIYEPTNSYKPTLGAAVHSYISPSGALYTIWDCAGDPRFGGLRDAYYVHANKVIICGCTQGSQAGNRFLADVSRATLDANVTISYCSNIDSSGVLAGFLP